MTAPDFRKMALGLIPDRTEASDRYHGQCADIIEQALRSAYVAGERAAIERCAMICTERTQGGYCRGCQMVSKSHSPHCLSNKIRALKPEGEVK